MSMGGLGAATAVGSNLQNELYCAPVNNTGLDPLQGFDFFVWVADVCTGKIAWFGSFQSLTLSIRDATETYLELGQRFPIQLNGEIQIAWVLEQGLVDMQFVYRTFGVKQLRRDMYVTRGPRFQISFDANANELETEYNLSDRRWGNLDRQDDVLYRWGAEEYLNFAPDAYAGGSHTPKGVGRYDIHRCKVDNLSMGLMPGRRVAAVRWEGVAEGISWVDVTVQTFKTTRMGSSGGFVENIAASTPPISAAFRGSRTTNSSSDTLLSSAGRSVANPTGPATTPSSR